MAAFDRGYGHIVVRVVYDGPSRAGKTTNLQELVRTFSSQRRGELSSPCQVDETTTYFDWLYLNGGVVAGYPLRAQLVTTPGRSALTRRRWQLVQSADVIVFVCDSTPGGLVEAKRALELLRIQLERASLDPPIIVQANKQDVPGALAPENVAAALGLPPALEIVSASVSGGTGVRETVVRAIRSAAAIAERSILARGVEALADVEDEGDLLARVDGTAQMRALLDSEDDPPPFPDEDVATGSVWPERAGRKLLRAATRSLAAGEIAHARTTSDDIVLRAGSLFMRTSRAWRRTDADAARAALAARARAYVRLGALHAPETTLVLAGAPGKTTWLWTIAPWATTLAERLASAEAASDEAGAASALAVYARALADALVAAARDGVGVDPSPARFGEIGGKTVYLSDRFFTASPAAIAEAAASAARRWARWPAAVATYASSLDAALRARGLGRAAASVMQTVDDALPTARAPRSRACAS